MKINNYDYYNHQEKIAETQFRGELKMEDREKTKRSK